MDGSARAYLAYRWSITPARCVVITRVRDGDKVTLLRTATADNFLAAVDAAWQEHCDLGTPWQTYAAAISDICRPYFNNLEY